MYMFNNNNMNTRFKIRNSKMENADHQGEE